MFTYCVKWGYRGRKTLSLPNESTSGGFDIEKRKVNVLVCTTYKSDFVKEVTSRLNQVKKHSLLLP